MHPFSIVTTSLDIKIFSPLLSLAKQNADSLFKKKYYYSSSSFFQRLHSKYVRGGHFLRRNRKFHKDCTRPERLS